MSISVLSINVILLRGIRNKLKSKPLLLFCQNKGADFYFIQETHATETDATFWKSQWSKQMWLSFGNNRTVGVAVLQGKFRGSIIQQFTDTDGRWCLLI